MNHGVKSCTRLIGRNAMIFVTGGREGEEDGERGRERKVGREKGEHQLDCPSFCSGKSGVS